MSRPAFRQAPHQREEVQMEAAAWQVLEFLLIVLLAIPVANAFEGCRRPMEVWSRFCSFGELTRVGLATAAAIFVMLGGKLILAIVRAIGS
jgi:hypothetical protein